MSLSGPSTWLPVAKASPPWAGVMSTSGIHIVRHRAPSSGQYIASWCHGRVAPAGLLEERLVVVEPHPVDAEQPGGDVGEPLGPDEAGDVLVVPPEVHHLQERHPIAVALVERTGLGAEPGDRRGDGVAVRDRLPARGHLAAGARSPSRWKAATSSSPTGYDVVSSGSVSVGMGWGVLAAIRCDLSDRRLGQGEQTSRRPHTRNRHGCRGTFWLDERMERRTRASLSRNTSPAGRLGEVLVAGTHPARQRSARGHDAEAPDVGADLRHRRDRPLPGRASRRGRPPRARSCSSCPATRTGTAPTVLAGTSSSSSSTG